MAGKRQLFIIPAETWDGIDYEEAVATATAMRELGIYALPYPEIDLWLPANDGFGWSQEILIRDAGYTAGELRKDIERGIYKEFPDGGFGPARGSGLVFEISRLSLDHDDFDIALHTEPNSIAGRWYRTDRPTQAVTDRKPHTRDKLCMALIVLLATRNAVKSTKQHKCARLGIGKGARAYEYVTTISLPREAEAAADDGSEPSTTGLAKAPHLRRGHIRRQHHGPHNALVKSIWIAPVFVNADKDWVDRRQRYNVSL